MTIDELDRVTIDEIGDVAILPRLLATVPPVMFIVITDVADEVNVAAVIADELVEAVLLRVVVR